MSDTEKCLKCVGYAKKWADFKRLRADYMRLKAMFRLEQQHRKLEQQQYAQAINFITVLRTKRRDDKALVDLIDSFFDERNNSL